MNRELTRRLVTKASPNRAFVINYWWRLSSRDFFIKSRSFRYFFFYWLILFCVNRSTRVYVFGLISFCFPFSPSTTEIYMSLSRSRRRFISRDH